MKYSLSSYRLIFALFLMFGNVRAQFINVDATGYTPQQLVEEFLGTKSSGCISISGVTVKGDDLSKGGVISYGYFDKGTSNFDIDKGIILSTGNVGMAQGGNTFLQSEVGVDWLYRDSDLFDILGYSNTNPTSLEFDFVSYVSDKVSFEYMFLSEEYDKDKSLAGCGYSDVFAFLIKEQGSSGPYANIALVPGTNDPVSVVNVRGSGGRFCPPKNEQYFGSFNPQSSSSLSPTNFNGQTKVLTAIANVEIGKTYHIKLVIADQGNPTHDSAVFLKAGSFVGIKNLGSDLLMANGSALCSTETHVINATPGPLQGNATNYTWYKDGLQVASGNIPKYTVDKTNAGFYQVEVDLDTGCKLKGQINIEIQILPSIGKTNFNNVCDDNLDGNADVYLNTYTQQIITNLSQDYNFDIRYFENPPVNINNPTEKPLTELEFSGTSKDVYLWIKPGSCSPILTKITYSRNGMSTFDNNVSATAFDICDDKLEDKKEIDISNTDYINLLIPAGYGGKLDFYKSRNGANDKNSKELISNTKTTLDNKNKNPSYFVRFHQAGLCDNVAEIKFNFKQPKKSAILKDTIICKGTLINLDAGDGFDSALNLGFSSYKWYKESDPLQASISNDRYGKNLSAGNYIVELGFNGCTYKQLVKISEPADLVINNVLIEGNNVTVLAANGIPPYQYSLDGAPYQPNYIFTVSKGNHTIDVKDACGSVVHSFTIIGIKNVITPNDDGVNDFIDYSDLLAKQEPRLEIYDRNGILIFKGDTNNQFIWNGKMNGRLLPTSSYWYILEWNESGNPKRVRNTGWILLKNRN